MSHLTRTLQKETPYSWNKFEKWYFKLHNSRKKNYGLEQTKSIENFSKMWFEGQLGFFILFLEENRINWVQEYRNVQYESWDKAIINSFKELEK